MKKILSRQLLFLFFLANSAFFFASGQSAGIKNKPAAKFVVTHPENLGD